MKHLLYVFLSFTVMAAQSKKVEAKAKEACKTQTPNIIYILADDLGYGDVKCFNAVGKTPTPNLDNMAKNGIMFTDAHTSSSVCTPTRYGILTGRYN